MSDTGTLVGNGEMHRTSNYGRTIH